MIKDKYHRDWYEKAKTEGRCRSCGKPVEAERKGKAQCVSCAKKHSRKQKARSNRWKKEGLCTRCGKPNDRKGKAVCTRCAGAYQRQRATLIDEMGGKCECCGEVHKEFLSIDHVNGGGNKARRKDKNHNRTLVGKILSGTEDRSKYRILCMNCNSALGFYGYCPHKTEAVLEEL
jgi:hypothetical protein